MEGTVPVDADQDDDATKLVPEWGRDGDDQVVVIGLAVVAVLALGLGWQMLSGDAGTAAELPTVESTEELALPAREARPADGAAVVTTAAPSAASGSPSTSPPAAATSAAAPASDPVTEVAGSVVGGVQEAVSRLPGQIEVAADGAAIVLAGFVANDTESRQAEQAAVSIDGVTEIRNELALLEPAVTRALEQSGVAGATAIGRGTSLTVSGTVGSEQDRTGALAAARAVEGVTEIIDDRLNLEVVTALNALPQVDFATGSARIPATSRPDLDQAAELLRQAGAVSIDIRGYTDTVGSAARNLRLSTARAEAVRIYLVDRGVGEATLTATGFGETEQFGGDPGANRVVRFFQIDE